MTAPDAIAALVRLHADLETKAQDIRAGAASAARRDDTDRANAENGRAVLLERQADALRDLLVAVGAPVAVPPPGQLALVGLGRS